MDAAAPPEEFGPYLDSLKTQRKLSPHTVAAYRRDLAELARLARALPGAPRADALSQAQVRRLAAQLHAGGLNPRSIARKLSTWRGFYRWLAERQALAANPVDGVKAPRGAKPLPKALPVDEAVRLVAQAAPGQDENAAATLCNRAMFELLYSSGLRVSELVALDVRYRREGGRESAGWVDFDTQEVIVTGKGGKQRRVPVGAPAMQALAAWLAARPALAREDDGALFLSGRGSRISARLVQVRLKAHGRALGIPTRVHPHALRHSFASHVLQSSGDLRAVQDMLGHASVASTQVYTALDFQRLAQVYDAAHPRAKKRDP